MKPIKENPAQRDTTIQRAYLEEFKAKSENDSRVRAVWIEGSFGRGNADRYSDLDLHVLVRTEEFVAFRNALDTWLAEIRPVPFCILRFEKMVNALTDNGLHIDIWLHTEPRVSLDRNKAVVVLDKDALTEFVEVKPSANRPPAVQVLPAEIAGFWRCIALLPSVVGRDELIVGFQGLSVEIGILVSVLLGGYGIEHDRGAKNLNALLPETCRLEIESALAMDGLSRRTLVRAHLALARLMQHYGPLFADQQRFAYPSEVEKAALDHVESELKLLELSVG